MISEALKAKRNFVQERKYKRFRRRLDMDLCRQFKKMNVPFERRSALLLKTMCECEDPIVFKDEKIIYTRTCTNIPRYFDDRFIRKNYRRSKGEVWDVLHNVCPDYSILLNDGLESKLQTAVRLLNETKNKAEKKFLESVTIAVCAVLGLADRYAIAASAVGNEEMAHVIRNVPRNKATSFHEALQSVRFVSSMFYLADNYQLGFGRMDQYLYPFYQQDIESGKLTRPEAKELLADFFISLNKDTDLYRGIQQGDNGQSVMLGGCKKDGSSAINDLTYLIMEVSRDLRLIDPKINLRIDSQTPDDLLELGSELTKCGLGFPQYSNDEAVIPALVKKGYALEDARDYTVAACWEYIIPGKGIEIVNQGAVSFPAAVDNAFEKTMRFGGLFFSMERLRKTIRTEIGTQVKTILKKRNIKTLPSPFASLFFDGALESKKDASISAKYKNIGIHGAASSNAADALVAIKLIFENQGISGLKELLNAKNRNFTECEILKEKLRNEMPKVGNATPAVDDELKFLFDCFADTAEKLSTPSKKIRPGSGSAMYYIWLSDSGNRWLMEPTVKATADGRLDKEAFSTSLAPSHGIQVDGILSVLKSFSNIDYSRIMNGGPITVELAPSVFSQPEGVTKLAQLIKYFVKLGNQQLQLNLLDEATLLDAVKNPEKHKNLIVRVWGWSGYFCELAPEYQQHVISRHKYGL